MADVPLQQPGASDPRDGPSVEDARRAALAALLRDADIVCPACAYSLRGVSSTSCPECGFELRVTLDAGRAPRGWIAFLLLAFGWLMLASAMNTIRRVSSLYGYATLPTLAPLGLPIDPKLDVAAVDWPEWYTFVPLETWFRLAWAVTLLLASLVGLVLTYRATRPGRRGRTSASVERLSRFAMLVFAIYAGTHVYWFLEEMLY
jgi:hypothetical protein